MIVDGFLRFLLGILEPIVSSIPQANLPAGIIDGWGYVMNWTYLLDYYVPVMGPFRFVLGALFGLLPALVAYRIGLWVFARVRN